MKPTPPTNATAGHTPTHTPGAVNAARIITGGDYDSPKRYRTAYGMKTCQGIADIIDRETHAPDMLEALKLLALEFGDVKPRSPAVDMARRCAMDTAHAAIARATGGQP